MDIFAKDVGFNEGPVDCQDGSLVVTSLDLGKVFRITQGQVSVLAETGGGANGATEGRDGQIFVTQNGGTPPALNRIRSRAGVQVIDRKGNVAIFGFHMKSPNDLCFGPDGYLYVTDPTRKPERNDGRIWRCNVETRECEQIFACDWYPNGIGFSRESDCFYVADSRHSRIIRLPLVNPRPDRIDVVIQLEHGKPDGFAFDIEGNLIVACPNPDEPPGDVQVYRDGKLLEVLRPGNSTFYTNVALSRDRRLYVCDADNGNVLVAPWHCPGLALYPFRDER